MPHQLRDISERERQARERERPMAAVHLSSVKLVGAGNAVAGRDG
jgi:hypothetical protein